MILILSSVPLLSPSFVEGDPPTAIPCPHFPPIHYIDLSADTIFETWVVVSTTGRGTLRQAAYTCDLTAVWKYFNQQMLVKSCLPTQTTPANGSDQGRRRGGSHGDGAAKKGANAAAQTVEPAQAAGTAPAQSLADFNSRAVVPAAAADAAIAAAMQSAASGVPGLHV